MSSKAELRALMRQRQAQRSGRVTHPLAKYAHNGGLQCKLCKVNVEEPQWQKHLKSARHTEVTLRVCVSLSLSFSCEYMCVL